MMKHTTINHKFLNIPVIWQGCGGVDYLESERQVKVWTRAVELGSNAFDTSELYGDGMSESLLSRVIQNVGRNNVFIATKVGPKNLQFENTIHSCINSLKRLKTDYIDLYQIHWNNPEIPLDETMRAFYYLLQQGMVKKIGVCNLTSAQIQLCSSSLKTFNNDKIKLASIQSEYNIFNRIREKDIIPYCESNSIMFMAYSPLKNLNILNKSTLFNKLSEKYNRPISQLVLNWIVKYKNTVVLSQTKDETHLVSNCQSLEFEMEQNDIELIDKEYAIVIEKICPKNIVCETTGGTEYGNSHAYKTLEEAIENKDNYLPSPKELSIELKLTKELSRPINVVKLSTDKYKLIGGNVRYWAWVIAFGAEEPIECIVENKRN